MPRRNKNSSLLFIWGMLSLIVIAIFLFQPLVKTRVQQYVITYLGFIIVLTIGMALSKRHRGWHPLFLCGQVGVLLAVSLKGVVSGGRSEGTDAHLAILLLVHFLTTMFGLLKGWPVRKLWTLSIGLILSGLFMDAFFWYAPAAFALPLILIPGLQPGTFRRSVKNLSRSFLVIVAGFLFIYFVSALTNPGSYYSIQRGLLFFSPAILLLSIRLPWLSNAILYGLIMTVLGYFGLLLQDWSAFWHSVFEEINPNRVAGYLAPALMFTLAALPGKGKRLKDSTVYHILAALAFLLGAVLLHLLKSEGALLAFWISCGLWLCLRFAPDRVIQEKWIRRTAGLALAILIAVVLTLFSLSDSKEEWLVWLSDHSHNRIPVWRDFLVEYSARDVTGWLIGRGALQFDSLATFFPATENPNAPTRNLATITAGQYVHSHNLFLEWLLGTGILGLLLFFALVFGLISYKSKSLPRWMPVIIVVILHGMVDFLMDIPAIAVFFWIPLAFMSGTPVRNRNTIRPASWWKAPGLVSFILLFAVFALQAFADRATQRMASQIPERLLSPEASPGLRECNGMLLIDADVPDDWIPKRSPASVDTWLPYLPGWSYRFIDPTTNRRNGSLFLMDAELTGESDSLLKARNLFSVCTETTNYHPDCDYGMERTRINRKEVSVNSITVSNDADPMGIFIECIQ